MTRLPTWQGSQAAHAISALPRRRARAKTVIASLGGDRLIAALCLSFLPGSVAGKHGKQKVSLLAQYGYHCWRSTAAIRDTCCLQLRKDQEGGLQVHPWLLSSERHQIQAMNNDCGKQWKRGVLEESWARGRALPNDFYKENHDCKTAVRLVRLAGE